MITKQQKINDLKLIKAELEELTQQLIATTSRYNFKAQDLVNSL